METKYVSGQFAFLYFIERLCNELVSNGLQWYCGAELEEETKNTDPKFLPTVPLEKSSAPARISAFLFSAKFLRNFAVL